MFNKPPQVYISSVSHLCFVKVFIPDYFIVPLFSRPCLVPCTYMEKWVCWTSKCDKSSIIVWQLWIWSHLKLEQSMSFCSTNWHQRWVCWTTKCDISSTTVYHICDIYEFGHTLSWSKAFVQQTSLRGQFVEHLSVTWVSQQCDQNHVCDSNEFGHP